MHFTKYVNHDGYYESICSLREGLGPIFKCRTVRRHDGDYDSIVRDYLTGMMVASKPGPMIYEIAKDKAKAIAVAFIKEELKEF